MTKTNKIRLFIIAITIVVFYGLYRISSFSLFEETENLKSIKTIDLADKNYDIKVYYIPSNATTQSNIQVRKVQDGIEETLGIYERYNFLESYQLHKDSLSIIINDTMRTHVKAKKINIKLP